MIDLSAEEFVAKGSTRYCYRHPANPDLCLKVPHDVVAGTKQNREEAKYFSFLERKGVDWSCIPRCYGWAVTSVGVGLIFDFLHTRDGSPMPNIKEYLMQGHITLDALARPLEKLRRYFSTNRIILRDLNATNVLCDVDGSDDLRLYVIDGIGNADYIKAANYWSFYASKKIDRHWARFMDKLSSQASTG